MPSFSKLSEDTGLEEDIELSEALTDQSEAAMSEDTVEMSSDYQSLTSERSEETPADTIDEEEAAAQQDTNLVDPSVLITTSDTEYSGIEMGELSDEKSNLSQVESGSQDTLLSTQSQSPSKQPNRQVNQDMNGNPQVMITLVMKISQNCVANNIKPSFVRGFLISRLLYQVCYSCTRS